jgi:hypothetical protein
MPYAQESTRLCYEDTGRGHPIALGHESGSVQSKLEKQVYLFSFEYRCLTLAARGRWSIDA